MITSLRYVLKNPVTRRWIALDKASGGYPFEVDDILDAKLWHSRFEASQYNAIMSHADYDNPVYEVHALTTRTEFVNPQLTGQALADTRKF